jgi:hypothetical protein
MPYTSRRASSKSGHGTLRHGFVGDPVAAAMSSASVHSHGTEVTDRVSANGANAMESTASARDGETGNWTPHLGRRAPAAGRDEGFGVAVAGGEEPEQFLDLAGGGVVVDGVGELVADGRDELHVGVAAGDRHALGLAGDDVGDGGEVGELAAVGHSGDVDGGGDGEALRGDLRRGRVLGGLGEGRGGAAGEGSGVDTGAALTHEGDHAGGDASRGGGGDRFGVDLGGGVGGGLGGGGAVDAGLELGELFGDAVLLECGLLFGADFTHPQFGADAVEVVGEVHRVGERVGVDVVEFVDAVELGDRAGFEFGEVGVAGEGQVRRGVEELFGCHVVLRGQRVVCGLINAL